MFLNDKLSTGNFCPIQNNFSNTNKERTVFLVDMNSYFASVEQAANPKLRGKPVGICGSGRTVVVTASHEARIRGVKTGMNIYEVKRVCPDIILVHGNLDKYVDTSYKIHKILLDYTDQVEVYSIDECFLDVTHVKEYIKTAREIKKRIKDELGLLCSVGVGPNKLLSKLASKMQKPDGLVEIKKENVPELFAGLPVDNLQGVGVGRKLSQSLKAIGINTAKDIGDASLSLLTAHFGVLGYHLKRMGKGEDNSRVKMYLESEEIKSVGHSHTLDKDTCNIALLKAYIRMLSEKIGVRLRNSKHTGRTIALTVRYSDFQTFSKHKTMDYCIKSGNEIYSAACSVFNKLLPLKKPVRLLGVSISSLVVDGNQLYLLDNIDKQQKISGIMDNINDRYGEFTIKPLSLLKIV